jgi:DNA-binding beta-propeller fold protein YncE
MNRRTFLSTSLAASVLLWSGCGSSSDTFSTPIVPGAPSLTIETLRDQMVTLNLDGTRFLLDFYGHSVSRLAPSGEIVWTVGDRGTPGGIFNFPVALQADGAGRLYVADRGNGEVDVLDEDGNLLRTIGRGQMSTARDLSLGLNREEVYVCDPSAHNLKIFGFDGSLKGTIGAFGQTASGLNFPTGVDFDVEKNELHVADYGNGRVLVFTPDGGFVRSYGSLGNDLGQFQYPESVVILPGGGSFVADAIGGFVTEFDASGTALSRFQPIGKDGVPLNPEYLNLGPGNVLIISGTPAFSGSA